jgi:hypothetical protein
MKTIIQLNSFIRVSANSKDPTTGKDKKIYLHIKQKQIKQN